MAEFYAVTGFKKGWAKDWRDSANQQGRQAMTEKLYQDIEIKIVNKLAEVPDNTNEGRAGIELRSIEKPFVLLPGEKFVVHTGIAIHIKHPNLMGIIVPRTGIGARHGIVLGNGTTIINPDDRGEILVCLTNKGSEPYGVNFGDRVAQLLLTPVVGARFSVVTDFSRD
ncbi:dUTPase [Burkholderia phage Bm1]